MRLLLLNKTRRKFDLSQRCYSVIFSFTDNFTAQSYNFVFDLFKVNENCDTFFFVTLNYCSRRYYTFKVVMSPTEHTRLLKQGSDGYEISSTYLISYLKKYFSLFGGIRLLRKCIDHDNSLKDCATLRSDTEAQLL